jgi:hypothetical protein
MFFRRCVVTLALTAGILGADHAAEAATRPYATVTDDGTLKKDFTKGASIEALAKKILARYDATGQERPEVLSVWSAFPMAGNELGTYFLPLSNDVRGIGLDGAYSGDGTFSRKGMEPTRAVLLHNDIRALDARARFSGSTNADEMVEYLFLLELSHLWGPAMRVPARAGADADAFIGFRFHWSFWMDAGGSPAGGNAWKDNADGTFTTTPQRPGTLTFSMLDLYLMGLASAEEVPPFGLLTDVTVTSSSKDPMTKAAVGPMTFPWFGETPVTVEATRVTYTIDDVIATNGPRSPALASSPKSLTLGIALVVGADTSDEDRATYEALMDSHAAKLAPAFERATRGRGKLEVVSSVAIADADPGPTESGTETPAPSAPAASSTTSSSCAMVRATERSASGALALAVIAGAAIARGGRRRAARRVE